MYKTSVHTNKLHNFKSNENINSHAEIKLNYTPSRIVFGLFRTKEKGQIE